MLCEGQIRVNVYVKDRLGLCEGQIRVTVYVKDRLGLM